MKRIPLTKGMEALVDDQDYDYLMQWKWFPVKSGSGNIVYARRNARMVNYVYETPPEGSFKMHRIVAVRMGMVGKIDHVNGDGLDNRKHFRHRTV